MIISVHGSLD
jgi:hypothetical protein